MGISHERARQIEASALAKLRKAVLSDADLSALAAHLFGDEVLEQSEPLPKHIDVRPEGFFEPTRPAKGLSKMQTDVAATLVETLRVCGPCTPSQLHAALDIPLASITTWLRELCDRGTVSISFKGHHSKFALTEVRR
jgi:hypothetical protein